MDRSEDIEDSGTDRKDGRWTDEEHRKFLEGLKKHGKDWKMIETIVKTRTGSQIRSHAQKYFNKLDRRRQLAWSPVGDQNQRHLKGILRHRPNRAKPEQKPDMAFERLGSLNKQYSDLASSNQAVLNAYAFNESTQANKSFFCSYVRPLLTNPEIVTNFLKETTDIEPKRDISQSRKSGTARRDSFSLIQGQDIERHRQFIETVKGKP